jgi:site-specific DNA-methyltransferase (adenine-specific)
MDIQGDGWKVLAGSCLDRLLELEDCSIDAVVTDPPYELGFMGKSWDSSGIAYNVEVWRQCLRVLKPGGHVLAFGGSRTWHRLAVAIEDAGFELRDSIAWIYGSGFPKSLDVSKAIDKAAGAEREVIGTVIHGGRVDSVTAGETHGGESGGYNFSTEQSITAPATDDAKKWQGWGTALKPAFEPVVVGRKPLTGTVASNVLAYGVGGLNIDGTRIGTEGGTKGLSNPDVSLRDKSSDFATGRGSEPISAGRWPSNVMLDEFTAGWVDQQSGFSKSTGVINRWTDGAKPFGNGAGSPYESVQGVADSGGASRFFYVAKASKRDRNEGLEEFPERIGENGNKWTDQDYRRGDTEPVTGRKNFHPTVKPTELMRNLIRLVTPLGGTVLDPFTGSGSTGKAAILEGMQFVGCELTPEYLPIIEGRINYAVSVKEQEALAEGEKLF